jgi:hypothetical protein
VLIVALARKLLIAFWKHVTAGAVGHVHYLSGACCRAEERAAPSGLLSLTDKIAIGLTPHHCLPISIAFL